MLVHTACYWGHCNCDLCSCSGHYACGTATRGSWFHQDPMPESLHSLKYTPQNRFNGNFPHESGLAASMSLSYLFSRYRDDARNTIDENSSVFSSDHIDYTISRYRSRIRRAYDIVAAIYRTISCMNARLVRALLTYRSGGV